MATVTWIEDLTVLPLVRRDVLDRVGAPPFEAGASAMRLLPAGTRPQSSQAPSTTGPPQDAHLSWFVVMQLFLLISDLFA
jgi:hypothetical protein